MKIERHIKKETNLTRVKIFQQMFTSEEFEIFSFGDINVHFRYKFTHPLQNIRNVFPPVLFVFQWMQTREISHDGRDSLWSFHYFLFCFVLKQCQLKQEVVVEANKTISNPNVVSENSHRIR